LDGVFDRVPQLKVVCVEAGCGWAAHLMDRLDEKYELLSFMQAPLRHRPSEYLQTNVWYVAEPGERSIDAMLDLVGEDRILWGSDFPHIDSRMDAADLIRGAVGRLTPARRDAVLGGNAAEVFGV
ncbi:MAG TPA: amidohydrolase family protein, partial [Acidimicrobiales bacterium]|nr:amidohydrolase family protein [Acidimicrobiales bacterium]